MQIPVYTGQQKKAKTGTCSRGTRADRHLYLDISPHRARYIHSPPGSLLPWESQARCSYKYVRFSTGSPGVKATRCGCRQKRAAATAAGTWKRWSLLSWPRSVDQSSRGQLLQVLCERRFESPVVLVPLYFWRYVPG